MRVRISTCVGTLLVGAGLFLLAAAGSIPDASAQQCDNLCRHRFDFKNNGGTCIHLGLSACRLCSTGNAGTTACLIDPDNQFTSWTCKYAGKDNLQYSNDTCVPVCARVTGTSVQTQQQSSTNNPLIVEYWTCQK